LSIDRGSRPQPRRTRQAKPATEVDDRGIGLSGDEPRVTARGGRARRRPCTRPRRLGGSLSEGGDPV